MSNSLLDIASTGKIYLSPDILQKITALKKFGPGFEFEFSIPKLIHSTGKTSGVAMALKRLLGQYTKWYFGKQTRQGWFKVTNF